MFIFFNGINSIMNNIEENLLNRCFKAFDDNFLGVEILLYVDF